MLLRADNIRKSYGIETVLWDVSIVINNGDRMGIVGANGVGKSTLLQSLVGEQLPDSGSVELGHPSVEIGYLPQMISKTSRATPSRTCLENPSLTCGGWKSGCVSWKPPWPWRVLGLPPTY